MPLQFCCCNPVKSNSLVILHMTSLQITFIVFCIINRCLKEKNMSEKIFHSKAVVQKHASEREKEGEWKLITPTSAFDEFGHYF